jgi:hypothetical protein
MGKKKKGKGKKAHLKHESTPPTQPVREDTAQRSSARSADSPNRRRNATQKAPLPEREKVASDDRRRRVHSSSSGAGQEAGDHECCHGI